jgi:hypothetical protein
LIPDLGRVGRIDLLDVDVFLVGADDRQAPGDALVVSERNADERRLAGAHDVPARRLKVDDVAERRVRHSRCGSLATTGWPVAEREAPTTSCCCRARARTCRRRRPPAEGDARSSVGIA